MPVVPDGPETVVPHELVPSTFILSQTSASGTYATQSQLDETIKDVLPPVDGK